MKNKPWLKSSGAKTEAGKIRSSMNALKHGKFKADLSYNQRLRREWVLLQDDIKRGRKKPTDYQKERLPRI